MLIITTGTNCINFNEDVHPLNSMRIKTRNNQIRFSDLNGNVLYDFHDIDSVSVNGTIHDTLTALVAALKLIMFDALT